MIDVMVLDDLSDCEQGDLLGTLLGHRQDVTQAAKAFEAADRYEPLAALSLRLSRPETQALRRKADRASPLYLRLLADHLLATTHAGRGENDSSTEAAVAAFPGTIALAFDDLVTAASAFEGALTAVHCSGGGCFVFQLRDLMRLASAPGREARATADLWWEWNWTTAGDDDKAVSESGVSVEVLAGHRALGSLLRVASSTDSAQPPQKLHNPARTTSTPVVRGEALRVLPEELSFVGFVHMQARDAVARRWLHSAPRGSAPPTRTWLLILTRRTLACVLLPAMMPPGPPGRTKVATARLQSAQKPLICRTSVWRQCHQQQQQQQQQQAQPRQS
jgi:hypothetical protein